MIYQFMSWLTFIYVVIWTLNKPISTFNNEDSYNKRIPLLPPRDILKFQNLSPFHAIPINSCFFKINYKLQPFLDLYSFAWTMNNFNTKLIFFFFGFVSSSLFHISIASIVSTGDFNKDFFVIWSPNHVNTSDDGKTRSLKLDQESGIMNVSL